ncbi:nitroreductase family protein [Rhodoferax sp.]|uniref:nitroreductase family protein n=1 Tax=Rhodoferax sp. TaxID=50421 RepID=UPI00284E16BD|nr:nitroreductase family protein [Rhodoferax sp.]MDR3369529.1 nitroreductase family protein [Rhodoferax sp.]
MSETSHSEDDVATVQAYHERTKHRLTKYAAGPDTLDWDAQPDPFRRYAGAPLTPLPLKADELTTRWADLFEPGRIAPHALNVDAIGLLFELSMALSAWKQYGPDRWAVRVNPSSGNLHPTEAWLVCLGVDNINDGIHHYAPREHALEQRASFAPQPDASATARAFIALTSIQWREAWKYGERAFRYCQLDVGHAIGALRYAAAALGWQLQPVACSTDQLAALLGLDRDADFGAAEREEPDVLYELLPGNLTAANTSPFDWPTPINWQGLANRLDRHPMYRWPVIDAVASATRTNTTNITATCPDYIRASGQNHHISYPLRFDQDRALARSTQPAATLIRQRRSAQRFEARARIPVAQLWLLLQALHPARLPFDVWPMDARVHVLLFAHRVDGLAPGAYLLPRSAAGADLLRQTLPAALDLSPVADAPADAPLLLLSENPALAGTLRTLNCHQALGSDAILGFALLAEFNPLPDAAAYRQRFQEAGLIGQVLYLEAEALGLAGTGIGCFFDDALHELIGLPQPAASAPLQSVYHFTIGAPVLDDRITTEPPYAHLISPKKGVDHG